MTGALMSLLGTARAGVSGAFESIATATAAGGESYLEFTSIPQTYTSLQVRFIGRNANAASEGTTRLSFTMNGDTSSIYAAHGLGGNGSSASASGVASQTYIGNRPRDIIAGNGLAANMFSVGIIDFHDYASTSGNKTVRVFAGFDNNSTEGVIQVSSGLYASTSAITSVRFSAVDNWLAGSKFALYGIKGA